MRCAVLPHSDPRPELREKTRPTQRPQRLRNLPDLRWTSTLRAHSWSQKSAFERGKIDAEALHGIAHGGTDDDARRTKV